MKKNKKLSKSASSTKKDVLDKFNFTREIGVMVAICSLVFLMQVYINSNSAVAKHILDAGNLADVFSVVSPTYFVVNVVICRIFSVVPLMFIPGLILFSTSNKPSWYFQKALIFFAIALVQRFVVYLFVFLFATLNEVDINASLFQNFSVLTYYLAFIAFCFLIVGLVNLIKINRFHYVWIILLFAILLSLFSRWISIVRTSDFLSNYLFAFIVPMQNYAVPTITNWFIVFAVGYLCGFIYSKIKNNDKILIACIVVGVIAFVVFFVNATNNQQTLFGVFTKGASGHNWIGIFDAILLCMPVFTLALICHYIDKFVPEKFINPVYSYAKSIVSVLTIAAPVAVVYVWAKLGFLGYISQLNLIVVWLFYFVYVALVIVIAFLYRKFIKPKVIDFFRNNYFYISLIIVVLCLSSSVIFITFTSML